MKKHTYLFTIALFLAIILPYVACKENSKSGDSSSNNSEVEKDDLVAKSNPKFMTISDIHLDQVIDSVDYGCDSGTLLWKKAQDRFVSLIHNQKPGFILYLGDLPVHENDNCLNAKVTSGSARMDSIHGDVGSVLERLRIISDSTNVPLLYLPGNNDGYKGDYASFAYVKQSDTITPFTLDTLGSQQWPIIKGTKKASYFEKEGNSTLGYYAAYPLGKDPKRTHNLKTIMLNTVILSANYYSEDNIDIYSAAQDQFDWMERQLKASKVNKEKVIIAMHIPPGRDGFTRDLFWRQGTADTLHNGKSYINQFVDLVDGHKDQITGILTSHTHMDELKRVFNKNNELIALCISTPGITVNHGNNPGMKVFEYDTSNYELLNYTTSFASRENHAFRFTEDSLYTFRTTYKGCPGATSMLDCISNISTDTDYRGREAIVKLMEVNYNVRHDVPATYKHTTGLDVFPDMK